MTAGIDFYLRQCICMILCNLLDHAATGYQNILVYDCMHYVLYFTFPTLLYLFSPTDLHNFVLVELDI